MLCEERLEIGQGRALFANLWYTWIPYSLKRAKERIRRTPSTSLGFPLRLFSTESSRSHLTRIHRPWRFKNAHATAVLACALFLLQGFGFFETNTPVGIRMKSDEPIQLDASMELFRRDICNQD